MPFYVKKRIPVEGHQWFENGDHPEDGDEVFEGGPYKGKKYEGKVVRYFRHPEKSGSTPCNHCGKILHVHGWIDTLEGGHIVCPGDMVMTGINGERWPVKKPIFDQTYEEVTDMIGPGSGG